MRSPTPPPTTPSDSSLKNLIFILYFMPVFPGCKICSLALSLELQVFFLRKQTKRKKKQSKRKSMLFGGHWHSFSTMSGTHQSLALTERVKVRHFLQCPRGWHCIKERERNSICIINYMKHTRLFAFSFFCWKKRLQKIIIYRDSLILGLI